MKIESGSVDVEFVTLKKKIFMERRITPKEVLKDLPMYEHAYLDRERDEMVFNIQTHILELDNHKETETEAVPLTWWDHFKEEVFPGFLWRRFPPKYRNITTRVSLTKLCPHHTTKFEDDTNHLTWFLHKGDDECLSYSP